MRPWGWHPSPVDAFQKPGFAAVGDAVQGAVFELDVPFLTAPALLVPPVAGKFPRAGALAEAAATRSRWEFLLTAAPLPMVKGTGSPLN